METDAASNTARPGFSTHWLTKEIVRRGDKALKEFMYAPTNRTLATIASFLLKEDLVCSDANRIFFAWERSKRLWVELTPNQVADIVAKEVEKMAIKECNELRASALKLAVEEKHQTTEEIEIRYRQVQKGFTSKLGSVRFCQDACKFLASILYDDTFETKKDCYSHLLPIAGGQVIDLTTGDLLPREREYYFTYECPCELKLHKKEELQEMTQYARNFFCTVFDNDEDRVDFWQLIMGYCLTGDVSAQVFFILLGMGANGKDTCMNILKRILGAFFGRGNKRILTESKAQSSHEAELVVLKGKRVAMISEIKDDAFDVARVTELTGSERLRIRDVREKAMEIPMTCKLMLLCNELPSSTAQAALMRRFVPIPFPVTFDEKFKGKSYYRQGKNPELLMQEIEHNLSGFLAWFVKGAQRWYAARKLEIPQSVKECKTAYEKDNDTVSQFIESDCELESDAKVKSSVLFHAYVNFCTENGCRKRENQTSFKQRMKEYGVENKRDKVGVKYVGIRLKTEDAKEDFPEEP